MTLAEDPFSANNDASNVNRDTTNGKIERQANGATTAIQDVQEKVKPNRILRYAEV